MAYGNEDTMTKSVVTPAKAVLPIYSSNYSRRRRSWPRESMRAFTLIELLVVISIIALLMAILVPALKSAKELAERVVCLNNTRQISSAVSAYAADQNGYFPLRLNLCRDPACQNSYGGTGVSPYVQTNLYYYVTGTKANPNCGDFDLVDSFIAPYFAEGPEYFDCPSFQQAKYKHQRDPWAEFIDADGSGYIRGDYQLYVGLNAPYIKAQGWNANLRFHDDSLYGTGYIPPLKISEAKPRTAVVGDSVTFWPEVGWLQAHPFVPRHWPATELPEGMNASFVDGSAEWVEGYVPGDFRSPVVPFLSESGSYTYYWPNPQ